MNIHHKFELLFSHLDDALGLYRQIVVDMPYRVEEIGQTRRHFLHLQVEYLVL